MDHRSATRHGERTLRKSPLARIQYRPHTASTHAYMDGDFQEHFSETLIGAHDQAKTERRTGDPGAEAPRGELKVSIILEYPYGRT